MLAFLTLPNVGSLNTLVYVYHEMIQICRFCLSAVFAEQSHL